MSKAIIKKNGTDYPLLTMPNHYPADRVYLDGDTTKNVQELVARKSDLTSISQSGATATQDIPRGTFFYLNGVLVKSKTAIANGATFTLNTNYEVVTIGEQISNNKWVDITDEITWNSAINVKKALYNKALKCIKIKFYCDNDGLANSQIYATLPNKYYIDVTKHPLRDGYYILYGQVSGRWQSEPSTTMDYFNASALVPYTNKQVIQINYPIAATAYRHICDAELFVV